MINTTLSPNTQADDCKTAVCAISDPRKFNTGMFVEKVRSHFQQTFSVEWVTLYDSARTAMFLSLKEFGIGEGDEVIIQAFTCVAAVNPIKWTGATPVFVDIDPVTYNADIDNIENSITSRTRAIIVQHTFGYPADVERIVTIAKKKNIVVMEDCSHTIGGAHNGKMLGLFGDIGIFSLGRDKGISGSFGGVAITKNSTLGKKLRAGEEFLSYPGKSWVFKQLFFTITTYLSVRYYETISIGKMIHFIAKRISGRESTSVEEKRYGAMPSHARSKLPNALAAVADSQLRKLTKINKSRHEGTAFYIKQLQKLGVEKVTLPDWRMEKHTFPIRFPLRVQSRDELKEYCNARNIFLGDWYDVPIAPRQVDAVQAGYKWGSCPNAEMVAKEIINLPLHINLTHRDMVHVINTIRDFYSI